MDVRPLRLAGLRLIRPAVYSDHRGFFVETYQRDRYVTAGIDVAFVQDNHARSSKNTLRGLHYQASPGQAKLIRVSLGRILDVVVDIRPDSLTFGEWESVELDSESKVQLFVPVGFAHGYCVLSDFAEVEYKVSSNYDASRVMSIRWNDPDIGVEWPLTAPVLSRRDLGAESFASYRKRVGR